MGYRDYERAPLRHAPWSAPPRRIVRVWHVVLVSALGAGLFWAAIAAAAWLIWRIV